MKIVLGVLLLLFVGTTQAQVISSLNSTSDLDRLRMLESKTAVMGAEMVALKLLYAELSTKVLDLKDYAKTQIAAQPKVAFATTLSNLQDGFKFIGPYEQRITLVYENAYTNIGNAYNPKTGIFTAPLKGVYHFSFTLFQPRMWSGDEKATGVFLQKNGTLVVGATDNVPGADSEDTSGNSATLLLELGDQVSVQLWEGRRVYTDGNKRNTFNGHLLFPL